MITNTIQSSDEIYAFIDTQNVKLSIRSQGWVIDFTKFRVHLKDKYKVSKAFLFLGYIAANKKVYKQLESSGYILIFKPTFTITVNNKKFFKGNVDAELVLQTMIEYPQFSKAIIVSGDGDFSCLHAYLAKKNKLLKIMVPNMKRYSHLLLLFEEYLVFMNGLKEKLKVFNN